MLAVVELTLDQEREKHACESVTKSLFLIIASLQFKRICKKNNVVLWKEVKKQDW